MIFTFPGFGNPPGTPETRAKAANAKFAPPPPASPTDPSVMAARENQRKKALAMIGREASILTSGSGVLGDPPLDRPRASSLLGGP